jgi:hypothetical protein
LLRSTHFKSWRHIDGQAQPFHEPRGHGGPKNKKKKEKGGATFFHSDASDDFG